MGLEHRIDALKTRHQQLEAAIENENARPHPDETEILSLKKEKLRIKDEIHTLARH